MLQQSVQIQYILLMSSSGMVYFTFHRMEGNILLTSAKKEMYVQAVHKGHLGVVNTLQSV